MSHFDYEAMVSRAKQAEKEFSKMTQEDVDRIFVRIAHEADKQRVPLAILAVEETQMGLVEDKVLKNGLACELVMHRYKNAKTVGVSKLYLKLWDAKNVVVAVALI
jgi:acetaldehyde dehydrogenase/alcohol dehydrogenase